MSEYFNTKSIIKGMAALPRPNNFILEAFFKERIMTTDEKIAIEDILDRTDGLAPFVHPENDPVSMSQIASQVREYSPAYLQFEHPLKASDYQNRTPGEAFFGSLPPEERFAIELVKIMKKHDRLVENRLEWMAINTLLEGSYTIADERTETAGKNQGSQVINFGREAVLEPTALTGTNAWWDISDGAPGTTSDPVSDIQDMINVVAEETGGTIDTIIVGANAWKGLAKNQGFLELLYKERRNGETANFMLAPDVHYGAKYKGQFNNSLEVWTYTNWYSIGSNRYEYMNPNKVLFIDSKAFAGAVIFGFIQDFDYFGTTEKFTKIVETGNFKKTRHLYTQSAPLVIPGRINTTAVMEVVVA